MPHDYFKKGKSEYFVKSSKDKPKESAESFEIHASKRYKKRDLRIETIEYELKD